MSIGPETLAIASIAATVGSTGIQIMGQSQAAAASKASYEYQAAVQRNNQIIAQRQADDARARGAVEADKRRAQAQQLIGRQRAALAGNGVEVDTGSALDITSDTAAAGELDALTVRANAEREALGYETNASNFGAQAGLSDFQASNSDATLANIGTLLGGAGSVADKWYKYEGSKPKTDAPPVGNYGATFGGPR